MEMSCQLHALATLPPRKGPLVPIGWVPEPVQMQWWREMKWWKPTSIQYVVQSAILELYTSFEVTLNFGNCSNASSEATLFTSSITCPGQHFEKTFQCKSMHLFLWSIRVMHNLFLSKGHKTKLSFICRPHNIDFIKNNQSVTCYYW